jgi:hypothetical protein
VRVQGGRNKKAAEKNRGKQKCHNHCTCMVIARASSYTTAGFISEAHRKPIIHRSFCKEEHEKEIMLCGLEVMDHNFDTLRRVSWQRRELKPIDHLPTINLWWPTPSPHALALVFEQWLIHASAGKSRSWAALPRRLRITSYRHLCLHFIFFKK